jgi:predicted HTH domain antitoxin
MVSKLISTRLPADIEKELEKLAKREKVKKTVLFRKVLIIGLQELKEDYAMELYRQGKVTLWKAAELAGLSLWEMIDRIREKKIPVKYDVEDAKDDLKLVFGAGL